jgi:choline dehydrogenase-like flavoprotein
VAEAVSRKVLNKRLFDSADDRDFFMFDTMIEQTPDPDSRVTLGPAVDRLGQRKAVLNWRLSDGDKQNLWRCFELIAAEFGRTGMGRLRLFDDQPERIWDELLSFGYHHMGTTRASDDPKTGVVDANLRVHGMSNLYVAGSSVFPTGGHVPPTFTIVALAVRLAAHLKEEAGR